MKSLVIIPTYNEIENIKNIVLSVLDKKDNFDVLIVDDSSPDGTSKVVEDIKKDYENRLHLMIRQGKNGLGTAYIDGFKWAIKHQYDYIFEMDADFSHDPDDLQGCSTLAQSMELMLVLVQDTFLVVKLLIGPNLDIGFPTMHHCMSDLC